VFVALHLLEQATRAGAPLSPGQGRFRAETLGRRGGGAGGLPPRPRCRSTGRRGGGGARRCRRRRATEVTAEGGAADATGESDAREKPEAASRAEVERTREIFFCPGIYAAGICRGGSITGRPYK